MRNADEKAVRKIVAHYLHTHQTRDTAPLEAAHVDKLIEKVRKMISNAGFGITVTQDHNGAWGPMGQTLITLRFADGSDHIEMSMAIRSVSSYDADEADLRFRQENK